MKDKRECTCYVFVWVDRQIVNTGQRQVKLLNKEEIVKLLLVLLNHN